MSSVCPPTRLGRLLLLCLLFLDKASLAFVVAPAGQYVTTRRVLPGTMDATATLLHHRQSTTTTALHGAANEKEKSNVMDKNRRILWTKKAIQVASVAVGLSALASLTRPAWAATKSRTDGYSAQKSEAEWKEQLSGMQYDILRKGGTERPGFSILETEKRVGTFHCAGCGTPLFASADKFNSGTGWPSFARGLAGVEVEKVNPMTANLLGAELRCATCGGHLGDVFQDGVLFVGTEAFQTGQRYCIDGAALIFYPDADQNPGDPPLRGDVPKPQKDVPSWLEPPKITPKQ